MAHERCYMCGTTVPHQLVNEYPPHITDGAQALGLAMDQFVALKYSHVSWLVVKFDQHNGPCGRPCIGALMPLERKAAAQCTYHDGVSCPSADCGCA